MSAEHLLAKVPAQWDSLVRPFLARATEFEAKEPLVAYFLRTHIAFLCMRNRTPDDKAGKTFLMALLDTLEREKAQLGAQLQGVDGRTVLTKMALMLFAKADDAERTGSASLAIVRLFYAAAILFDATAQFSETDAMYTMAAQKSKYAKYIAARMKKALDSNVAYESPNKLEAVEDADNDDREEQHQDAPTTVPPPYTPPPAYSFHETPNPTNATVLPLSRTSVPIFSPAAPPGQHPASYDGPASSSTIAHSPGSAGQPIAKAPPTPTPSAPMPSRPYAPAPVAATGGGGTSSASTAAGFKPSIETMIDAQKLASQAVSALQFYDYENAKKQLVAALRALNGA